jgi:hypothetical protein
MVRLLRRGDTQTGVLLPPVHPAGYEPMLEVVRDSLGAAGFAAAHDRLAGRPPPELVAAVTEDTEETAHE